MEINFKDLPIREKARVFSQFCAGLIWYAELEGKEFWFREAGQYMEWYMGLSNRQKRIVESTPFKHGEEFKWSTMGRRFKRSA